MLLLTSNIAFFKLETRVHIQHVPRKTSYKYYSVKTYFVLNRVIESVHFALHSRILRMNCEEKLLVDISGDETMMCNFLYMYHR